MKKGIHPEYNEIDVTRTDGSVIKIFSTSKKPLVLSSDNLNHWVWTGQRNTSGDKGARSTEFKKKFDGFNL